MPASCCDSHSNHNNYHMLHDDDVEELKPDKRDHAVAQYLHNKLPPRVGDLHGMEVSCFFAEDAVNCLLDSPWASGDECIFTDRRSVLEFCNLMIAKELFHRAVLAKRKQKPRAIDGNDTPGESGTEGKKKKKSKRKEGEDSKSEEKSKKSEVKKVKKLKLEMSEDQTFVDGREPFVWIYEPVSWTKWLIGFGILFGAVALCCYPLWPDWMRMAVYYLSLCGAAFLGVILSLAILRYVVWGIVYALTMGKHSFFLFPNLTEDCGFFESFVPVYEYNKVGEEKDKKSKKNKAKEAEEETTSTELASGDSAVDPPIDDTGAGGKDGDTGSENSQPSDFEVIQDSEITS